MLHISLQLTAEEQEEQTKPEETVLTGFNDLDKPSPQFCKETLHQTVFSFTLLQLSISCLFSIRCNH